MESKLKLTLNQTFYNSLDPLYGTFIGYESIQSFVSKENDKINIIKHLYYGKNQLNSKLSQFNELIEISLENKEQKSLAYNFYLNLLISFNSKILNYTNLIDFIKILNEGQKMVTALYTLILLAKIIIDLISNFRKSDKYDKNIHEELLMKIEEDNKNIIKNNKKELTINKITFNETDNIDKIYIEIIKALIKNKKLENYENTLNIINQLDLENISLTDIMLRELAIIFDSNEKYINDYMIYKENDLYDEIKVNFYFIFFKYILKNPIYIYQFTFLLNIKKKIIMLLKNNILIFERANNNIKIKKKFYFILKFIADSEYYVKRHIENNFLKRDINNKYNKLLEVLDYYQYYFFESKKNEIHIIEDIINNNKNNFENYLINYDLAKKMNDRILIIDYIYDYVNNKKEKTEEELKIIINKWEVLEERIRDKKTNNLKKYNKIMLIKYFCDKNNENILNKIFNKEQIDFFIKNNIKFLNEPKKDPLCIMIYNAHKPKEKKESNNLILNSFTEFHKSNLDLILRIIDKSIFIFNRNDDSNFFFENIYIGNKGIRLVPNHIIKILDFIKNIKNITIENNNDNINNFIKLCSFANELINKLEHEQENKIKKDYYTFYNLKNDDNNNNTILYLNNLDDDINDNNHMMNSDKSTRNSIIEDEGYIINKYQKLNYNGKLENKYVLMKKMINHKGKIIIIFWNFYNELFHFNKKLEKIEFSNAFIYNISKNRIETQLKQVQEMINNDKNNNKFKVNCLCKILTIPNKNKEVISYIYLGGSENGSGKIKLYSFSSGQYKYIQDIIIEYNNDIYVIPPVKNIVWYEKEDYLFIQYDNGEVGVFNF